MEKIKKVLFVAYHYPPVKVSSAVQRILKFTKYLNNKNWQSIVLTITPKAVDATSDEQVGEIPANTVTKYCFAFNTKKHLSYKGRYFRWMALPDQWVSWIPFGTFEGLKLIRKYKPDIIFSTYPIASSHIIAYLLNKISKIPWVADFRDSMAEDYYLTSANTRCKVFYWVEKKVVYNCTKAIFTTPGAVEMYARRYPDIPRSRWQLIPNGYDEENFIQAEKLNRTKKSSVKPITLLHSGVIYPCERDPRDFLAAIAQLKVKNLISSKTLRIILRATGHDNFIQTLINEHKIDDIVFVQPTIAYKEALAEMLSCDGLLILQAENCNHQVPAKVYEYLRSQRPIFALTDNKGDTAQILLHEGFKHIVPLDNEDAIAEGLIIFIKEIVSGNIAIPALSRIKKYSRQSRSNELADIFNQITTTK